MQRFRALTFATALCLAGAGPAAQSKPDVTLPASPRGLAAIQVSGSWTGADDNRRYTGGAWISVDYGRPILRGRQNIFGSGAAYGQLVKDGGALWRAGANETTRLTTQATLVIGGTTLAPGVYNVLVDLKENNWTLVLTNQPAQQKYDPNEKVLLYGAYNYNPKHDVLRAPMEVSEAPHSVEQFTIGFLDVQTDRGTLYMAWDRTVARVPFTVKP
jgi:hypothetical protein